MANSETRYLEEPAGIKHKLLLLFNIFICSGLIVVIFGLVGGNFIDNYHKVQNQVSYLSVSKWALPSLIGVFMMPGLIYIFILRLCKKLTQLRSDHAMKYIIVVTVTFLISRLFYGFALTYYLENNGYSYCYDYSSSSVMGNNTWLKDPAYCMKNITANRSELQEWFDQQDAQGTVLTLESVQQEILKMDAVERAKYPDIYD